MMDCLKTVMDLLGSPYQLCGWLTPGIVVTCGIAGFLAFKFVLGLRESYGQKEENDLKRLQKREKCEQSIKDLTNRLQDDPLREEEVKRITGLSLQELIKELKDEKITPSHALKAYQTKALEAHEKTNCLVEVITEAEEWAEAVAKTPKDGLLWGVPISVKEDLVMKGYDTTVGCVEFIGKPAEQDCLILKLLKNHGAVPFVRTNLPQLALSYEPGNPIFGKVQNPHKMGHGSGGSSSGESALIAAGGSILGIGSDIGGSIRVPAHFTGISGFKPTVGRMSNYGVATGMEQTEIDFTYGPMANDVDALVLSMKALWDGKSLSSVDPESIPFPFDDEEFGSSRRLKVGYYTEASDNPVFSPCKRAVLDSKVILEKLGHEVVEWTCPDLLEADVLMWRFMKADGGVLLGELLKYDIVDDSIKPFADGMLSPHWIRWIQAKLARFYDPELAKEIECTLGIQKTLEYWYRSHELKMYAAKVMQSWSEAGLDVVICPPVSVVAPRFGNAEYLYKWTRFSFLYNIANFPAGVVPMTTVTSADIDTLKDFPTDTVLNSKLKEAMGHCLGLPAGVMVVSPRFKDEVSLRVMSELQKNKAK